MKNSFLGRLFRSIFNKEVALQVLKAVFSKDLWISLIKDKFIKFALKKILGTAIVGGFAGWIIAFAADEVFDEFLKPKLEELFRLKNLAIDKVEGKITVKKLEETLENNDVDGHFDVIDDAFDKPVE